MTWEVCELRFGKHHKYILKGKLELNGPSVVDGGVIKMDCKVCGVKVRIGYIWLRIQTLFFFYNVHTERNIS